MSVNEQIRPKFSLFLDNDNDELVGSFHNVEGIELPLGDIDGNGEIKFFNGSLSPSFDEKCTLLCNDIKICICDEKGELIASFSGVSDDIIISYTNNRLMVTLQGHDLPFISYGALSLWLERRKGFPSNKGGWIDLSSTEREAWLEVALLDLRRIPFSIKGKQVEIDGAVVQDQISFLCALGEAVFGPGGYIGRNLSALEDCLTGEFGVEHPLQLFWINSKSSEYSFRYRGESEIYKSLLNLLAERNVKVVHR